MICANQDLYQFYAYSNFSSATKFLCQQISFFLPLIDRQLTGKKHLLHFVVVMLSSDPNIQPIYTTCMYEAHQSKIEFSFKNIFSHISHRKYNIGLLPSRNLSRQIVSKAEPLRGGKMSGEGSRSQVFDHLCVSSKASSWPDQEPQVPSSEHSLLN